MIGIVYSKVITGNPSKQSSPYAYMSLTMAVSIKLAPSIIILKLFIMTITKVLSEVLTCPICAICILIHTEKDMLYKGHDSFELHTGKPLSIVLLIVVKLVFNTT